VRNKLGWSVQT
jgi:hypothetical protein